MAEAEKTRVSMGGRSQAVRNPVEYRFTVNEVFIRRDPLSGDLILSEKPQQPSLEEVFALLDAAGGAEDLLRDRDLSVPDEREWM
jgi:antitoxin VapB